MNKKKKWRQKKRKEYTDIWYKCIGGKNAIKSEMNLLLYQNYFRISEELKHLRIDLNPDLEISVPDPPNNYIVTRKSFKRKETSSVFRLDEIDFLILKMNEMLFELDLVFFFFLHLFYFSFRFSFK